MNILFTVCGRGGSKGIKNKNIRDFLHYPLYRYTLQAIRCYIHQQERPATVHDVVVSTDSVEFLNMLQQEKHLLLRNRPAVLAEDATPKMPVILDALNYAQAQTERRYDLVVDLDITSPIRTTEHIRNAIQKKIERPDTDVVFSVTHARRNPYFNMVKQEGSYYERALPSNYTARQQAPVFYDMNASIYVYAPAFLMSGATSPLDGKADIILMPDTGVIDIDSEEDFTLMELIAGHLRDTDEAYGTILGLDRNNL